MATIIDRLRHNVKTITRYWIRRKKPAPTMIRAGICWDLESIMLTYHWTYRTIAAGTEKQLIKELNMQICRKCEAQALLVVGEMVDSCWIIEKTKIYWIQAM